MAKEFKKKLYAAFPKMKSITGIWVAVVITLIGLALFLTPLLIYKDKAPESFDPTDDRQVYVTVDAHARTYDFACSEDETQYLYYIMDDSGYDTLIVLKEIH